MNYFIQLINVLAGNNFASIFLPIFFLLILPGIIGLIILKKHRNSPEYKAKVRGNEGEEQVKRVLNRYVKKYGGHIINDVIIPGNGDMTSQIDHILFTTYGIYAIETKNYSGFIYGGENNKEWTQFLNKKTSNKFYNPIKQNKTHVTRLLKIIGKNVKMTSIVVFVSGNIDHVDAKNVYKVKQLMSALKYHKDVINYSEEEILSFYNSVLYYKQNPIKSTKEHIENIHKHEDLINKGICPVCGGFLVSREGKNHTVFLGCSNYPKCKFKKQL